MKRLLTLVFTAILLCVLINAQNDTDIILAKGNPPLTQSLADELQKFFEWTLDRRFNETQRQMLNKLLIAEWKTGNQSDINESLKLMAIPSNLNKFNTEQQKELHDKVQAGLLEQIRNDPNNELSRLLADVRNSDDNLNQTSSGVIPAKNGSNTTTDAKSLVGEWLYRIRGSSIAYTDGAGGYADPSGDLSGYKLHANGTFENGYLLSQSLYGCNLKVFGYATGNWWVQGDKLIFKEKISTLTSKDNCRAAGNYEKKRELKHYYYNFRLERDEYGPKISFLRTDGTQEAYYKQEKGQMGW